MSISKKTLLTTIILTFWMLSGAHAEESSSADSKKYDEMSIEELMNVKIGVGTKLAPINRTAGIVTLITADDIAHMGARDITDILMSVPGFSLSFLSQGEISMGFRGLNAFEKTVYLIDNVIVNEALFQEPIIGRRLPVSQIDRIEIIRGPGSVKYGQNAELAVVKITTKLAARSKSSVSAAVGQQEYGSKAMKLEGMFSKSGDIADGGALVSYSVDAQSEQNVTDTTGYTFNMTDHSQIADKFAETQLHVGRFSAQFLMDNYVFQDAPNYGVTTTNGLGDVEPVWVNFDMSAGMLDYKYDVTPNLTVRPYVNYHYDRPYQATQPIITQVYGPGVIYDRSAYHYEGGIDATYAPSSGSAWIFGVNSFEEVAHDNIGNLFERDNALTVRLYDSAAFVETTYDLNWAELTAGVRYDKGVFGDAIVPRFAILKDYESWGYKFLLTKSYRPPGIEQTEDTPPGTTNVAESTTVAEVELNKKISSNSVIAANLYWISVKDILAYGLIGGVSYYTNYPHAGSKGLELTYQFRNADNLLKANVSYAQPDGLIQPTEVPGHTGSFLGRENFKAVFQDTIRTIGHSIFVTPSLTFISGRYGFDSIPAGGVALRYFEPIYYANLVFEKQDFLHKDIDLTVGVYNLLNQDYRLPQTYASGQEPEPSQSREYMAKLSTVF